MNDLLPYKFCKKKEGEKNDLILLDWLQKKNVIKISSKSWVWFQIIKILIFLNL